MVIAIEYAIWKLTEKRISDGEYFRLLNMLHRGRAFEEILPQTMPAKPIKVKSIHLKVAQNFRGKKVQFQSKICENFCLFPIKQVFLVTVDSRYLHKFCIRSFSSIEQAEY